MPVDSKHREYSAQELNWKQCRDCIDGEEAVKKQGPAYLPALAGGDYTAYKQRALFFGATSRTVQGLQGAVFRKDYTLEYPESKRVLLDDITEEASNVDVLLRNTVREVLEVGRTGFLVDVSTDDDGVESYAYVAQYKAENILNWRSERINGSMTLVMVALLESYDNPNADGHDKYNPKEEKQVRMLLLVPRSSTTDDSKAEGMVYKQDVYRKNDRDNWELMSELSVVPENKGIPLDYIPFMFVNSDNDEPNVNKPPLLDMVNVNLSHYRTSADLEHGAHFTALPTAVLTGFDPKNTYSIGSGRAWVTSNHQASAKYLEYTGQGLGALRDLKKDKEQMMAVLGARFLEESKRVGEAAETLRIRASADAGTLESMVGTIDEALTTVLQWHATWSQVTEGGVKKIKLTLNKDFVSARLQAPEIVALMKARQAGELSQDSFLHNLKEGEILPDGRTIEEEKDLIEVDSNDEKLSATAPVTPIRREFELQRDEDGKATGIKEA